MARIFAGGAPVAGRFMELQMFRRPLVALTVVAAFVALAVLGVQAQQPGTIQFVVGAVDKNGEPLKDLKAEEIIFNEKAGKGTVTKFEPFALPVKITIAVDNGNASGDALPHYRAGLKGFVEAFPEDVEMSLYTTSPQPRPVVRPTTDRAAILRGVNGFAPESEAPRFTDALVEWSQRLEKESKDTKIKPYVPVMLAVSTTSAESTSYQPPEIQKWMNNLVQRRARLFVSVNSTRSGDARATADMNTARQVIIAVPYTKALNGRYEAIAIFNRLQTLLPEYGKELADYHKRLTTQYLVTVQRASSAGPVEGVAIEIAREGVTGSVSLDGYFPR